MCGAKIHLVLQTILLTTLLTSCKEQGAAPSSILIADMNLKKGDIISCGPADQKLGTVNLDITGTEKAKKDFLLGLKLLHSFEYDESEKVFAKIIEYDPACAMAYWGVAMSNFHALWAPPSAAELRKGAKAIGISKQLEMSAKEADYLEAISAFYEQSDKVDHLSRCRRYEKAMEDLHAKYPGDKEIAVFYALALNAAADPKDKQFAKQKKAASILNELYPGQPDHPGIVHYTIHTYDYPGLAELALPAARKYAAVAPSSAHALHMPSHIFTRLGLWTESIRSNLESVSAAKCYAEQAGIKGHWDEELHGLDYLVYAHLQRGENEKAKERILYLQNMKDVQPVNFKVAYAFAAIPARFVLENKMWKEASSLAYNTSVVGWENFPWQKAIIHFTRVLGAVHTGNANIAQVELKELKNAYAKLLAENDAYKADQVAIQVKTAEAWIEFFNGDRSRAISWMTEAAAMEDRTGKHPVTPGEVIPARELLGDMFMHMKNWKEALVAYEASLKTHPHRLNGSYGAAVAAERSGDIKKARVYYQQLLSNVTGSERPEIEATRTFMQNR